MYRNKFFSTNPKKRVREEKLFIKYMVNKYGYYKPYLYEQNILVKDRKGFKDYKENLCLDKPQKNKISKSK